MSFARAYGSTCRLPESVLGSESRAGRSECCLLAVISRALGCAQEIKAGNCQRAQPLACESALVLVGFTCKRNGLSSPSAGGWTPQRPCSGEWGQRCLVCGGSFVVENLLAGVAALGANT